MLLSVLLSVSLGAPQSDAEIVLQEHCLRWAAEPTNPWALAHGIKTFGPTFRAADGRPAAEVIIHDFLLQNRLPDAGPGSGAPLGFARYAVDGTPIEPHSNLNVKALVADAKIPLSTKFGTSWGPVTLKQLVDSVKAGFRHSPQVPEYWKDVGWTLGIFAATQKPGTTWKSVEGQTVSMNQVFDDALLELENQTAELKEGLEQHRPQIDKRKQGLYAHSCGGLHFVQGVLAWARFPQIKKKWGARLNTQIAIHFYRLESERRQYEDAFQQTLSAKPQYKLQVLVQMVKFYGHWLETVAHFRDDFGWKPNEIQKTDINRAKALLDQSVRLIEENKAFESMPQLKTTQKQVYFDLIGDSCHATHGLAAWR